MYAIRPDVAESRSYSYLYSLDRTLGGKYDAQIRRLSAISK